MPMECEEELPTTEENEFDFNEVFPLLTGTANSTNYIVNQNKISSQKTSVAPLMAAIKGLLDLTNDYLQNLDKEHPSVAADFLALLADGASCAMRGERVYVSLQNTSKLNTNSPKATWAQKVARASPSREQSKEDRRVMICVGSIHEARKTESFELRQKVQNTLPDKSLVSDAWFVPSGFKDTIKKMLGEAIVERQETWKTFLISPIPKIISGLDGIHNTMEGPLQEELAVFMNIVSIRYIGWTRRTQNEEPYGYIRIFASVFRRSSICSKNPSTKSNYGIREVSLECAVCARSTKCGTCDADAHNGTCQSGPRCLNCWGPHNSNDFSCPARPHRSNGILKRPIGAQLHHIRTLGGREYAKVNRRSSTAHNIILKMTHEQNIEILLIQEPWILRDLSIHRSVSHHTFESISPFSTWHIRPRVLTYIRKSSNLKAFQVAADFSRDLIQIMVNLWGTNKISIWIVYNVPIGSDEAGTSLTTLLNCTDTPYFIGGDLNLRNPS
ncbi:hypothetical protein EPUL_002800, partial [Erysiphe pulchra]